MKKLTCEKDGTAIRYTKNPGGGYSYRISSLKEKNDVLNVVSVYDHNNPSENEWKRSRGSMIWEWIVHDEVYKWGFARSSTAHVDLNVDDEGKGFIAFAWERVIKPKLGI